jgi:hypothetical protein
LAGHPFAYLKTDKPKAQISLFGLLLTPRGIRRKRFYIMPPIPILNLCFCLLNLN